MRIFWLPLARDAFIKAHETNSAVNGALAEGIHAVRTVQGMGREALNAQLYKNKVLANLATNLHASRIAQVLGLVAGEAVAPAAVTPAGLRERVSQLLAS